ncbi:hypothetical protein [Pseudoduganella lutea]|uniref:Uncharacterized protein n=1 Tax=Pseudoduganella lutea TaxID=321985 RepID=A0A4P6L4Z6_9BURK|nr:hypothetical protein [Pseudoduganella lutea]QBE66534.1 hypothetical protein EWM63_29165 [Pseudoduganella lutea]
MAAAAQNTPRKFVDIFLDEECWRDIFKGYDIVDVAVLDHRSLHFCLKQAIPLEEASMLSDADIPTRLVVLYTDRPAGKNCGSIKIDGMTSPRVGVSRPPFPRPSGLVAARGWGGDVYPRGGGIEGPLEQIAPRKPCITERLKCINGFTYAAVRGRGLYKRVDLGRWVPFDAGLPKSGESPKMGFQDIDAFSDDDMYAVGGEGDVWHFDGTSWKRMHFQDKARLATVTCAGDGNVYISGEGGSLWVGAKSRWKPVCKGNSNVSWNDVLWFQDKLWLASDDDFCHFTSGGIERVTHDGGIVPMCGHMDAHNGILVIADLHRVMSFDGSEWRTLVAPYGTGW